MPYDDVLPKVEEKRFFDIQNAWDNGMALAIARRLEEYPKHKVVAFIENGTTERQRVILTDLYELSTNPPEVSPPAIMVVGKCGKAERKFILV